MNDVSEAARARQTAKPTIVRPRDAASLILLRGKGRVIEAGDGEPLDTVPASAQ